MPEHTIYLTGEQALIMDDAVQEFNRRLNEKGLELWGRICEEQILGGSPITIHTDFDLAGSLLRAHLDNATLTP